jgi:hypothetical protein
MGSWGGSERGCMGDGARKMKKPGSMLVEAWSVKSFTDSVRRLLLESFDAFSWCCGCRRAVRCTSAESESDCDECYECGDFHGMVSPPF